VLIFKGVSVDIENFFVITVVPTLRYIVVKFRLFYWSEYKSSFLIGRCE